MELLPCWQHAVGSEMNTSAKTNDIASEHSASFGEVCAALHTESANAHHEAIEVVVDGNE